MLKPMNTLPMTCLLMSALLLATSGASAARNVQLGSAGRKVLQAVEPALNHGQGASAKQPGNWSVKWYSTGNTADSNMVGSQKGNGYTACTPAPSSAKTALFIPEGSANPIKYSSYSDRGCTKPGPSGTLTVDVSKNKFYKITAL